MHRRRAVVLTLGLLGALGVFAAAPNGLSLALPGGGELTNEERKAIRLEMIEFDVNLRSIPSLIALEDKERAAHYFGSYTVFETSENPSHKENFQSALQKLKDAGLYHHLETIQKEGDKAAAWINEKIIEKNRTDWGPVYRSYQVIIENCRRCHEAVFAANKIIPDETKP